MWPMTRRATRHKTPHVCDVAALSGALLVFDRSHKGSHLALMVEILAGALVGADVQNKKTANNWGTLLFAIDPAELGPTDDFHTKTEAIIARVRSARKLPGVSEILMPGERGNRLARRVVESGQIEVEANLTQQLRECAAG
mmetsp:Transcript_371/g.1103  ORF Transcript_371/g.1103 Transcript_371/m.1103 type:complete len:141 (+) Transcript_371:592-1014(+)